MHEYGPFDISRADDMEGLGALILALCYGYSGEVAN
jgi:hypothetical protein